MTCYQTHQQDFPDLGGYRLYANWISWYAANGAGSYWLRINLFNPPIGQPSAPYCCVWLFRAPKHVIRLDVWHCMTLVYCLGSTTPSGRSWWLPFLTKTQNKHWMAFTWPRHRIVKPIRLEGARNVEKYVCFHCRLLAFETQSSGIFPNEIYYYSTPQALQYSSRFRTWCPISGTMQYSIFGRRDARPCRWFSVTDILLCRALCSAVCAVYCD